MQILARHQLWPGKVFVPVVSVRFDASSDDVVPRNESIGCTCVEYLARRLR